MRVRALATVGMACLLFGCRGRQPAPTVVDLSVGRLPPGEHVAIDDRPDDPVWRSAAVLPFERTGEARFLWDGERLYGLVGKWDKGSFGGLHPYEQLRVVVSSGSRSVQLGFESGEAPPDGLPTIILAEAWCLEWSGGGGRKRTQLVPGLATGAGSNQPTQQGGAWRVSFALAWSALGAPPSQGKDVNVTVYRMVPQWCISHIARMTAGEILTDPRKTHE